MKRQYFISIFCFVVAMAVFALSLWGRPVHIDDVWLAEYSYWLNKLGYVKSEAMRGFFGAEDKLMVHHKLMQIQGAWVIRAFGFSVYPLKAISLFYTVLTVPLLFILYRKGSPKGQFQFLLLALYLSFFHTMNLGFIFRPEAHLVFWGLASYLLLDGYLSSGKRWLMVLGAVLSGVGIATHLNGVVFTGASVLLLWIYRRWWAGFIFGSIATWGLIFFFTYDVGPLGELQHLFAQLTNWRDVASGKYGWDSLFRIFTEVSRYLHSPPEMIYSLMLLLLLIPARKYLALQYRQVLIYTGLISLLVALVTHGHNTNYLMYAMPFLFVIATWSFEYVLGQGKVVLAWGAVITFLVGSWSYDASKFFVKDNIEFESELQQVVDFLPAGAHVLAAHLLIFPGIEKLRIQSFVGYRDKVELGTLKKEAQDLFKEASKYDIEYVVVDKSNQKFFDISEDRYEGYHLMKGQPSLKQIRIYQKDL